MRIEFEKNFFSGKFEKTIFLKIVKNFLVDFRRGGNYCVNSGTKQLSFKGVYDNE